MKEVNTFSEYLADEERVSVEEHKRIMVKVRSIGNKAGIPFEEVEKELLKDEEFRLEYEKLKPRYDAIKQIILARKEQNMTQAELAKRVGTKKSNISRLESGNYNPSLDLLTKVASALGKSLNVQLN